MENTSTSDGVAVAVNPDDIEKEKELTFFSQRYGICGGGNSYTMIVIAEHLAHARAKITSNLAKNYGHSGFSLNCEIAGPYNFDEMSTRTKTGLGLVDVLSPADKQIFLEDRLEKTLAREEQTHRKRKQREIQRRYRDIQSNRHKRRMMLGSN